MSSENLEPGTLLNDRYRIVDIIGKGGMGTVYQAEHTRLDTILAIKEVCPPVGSDTDTQAVLEKCHQEARFLVRLHHPNLPQVTDAFVENGRFFVAMEYIEGVTLEARQRAAGPEGLGVNDVLEWSLQVADVLAYLHSQDPPIIFRDLKPSNVMIQSDGRVRLIDFGIARRFQPGAIKDTALLGSVGYSPPEQFGRHQTDTRSDIYSFGAMLHNLLTGRDPAASPFKFASARTLNPAVPQSLSNLIDACVRLDADSRPQSIHAVAMELLAIRDAAPVVPAAAVVPSLEIAPDGAAISSGPNIILTNPSLRGTGRAARGSQGIGSQGLNHSGSASQRTGGTPSGGVSPEKPFPPAAPDSFPQTFSPSEAPFRSRTPLLIGGTAVLAALLIGLVLWFLQNHAAPRSTPPPGQTGPSAFGNNGAPLPGDRDHDALPSSAPPDSGNMPGIVQRRQVRFSLVAVKDAANSPRNGQALLVEVRGIAEGEPGDVETIVAYFYDGHNTPLDSQAPGSPFAGKDGKLSTATTVTLASATQPFDIVLELPLSAFPPAEGVQFHCVAFYRDQRIGESEKYITVPPGVLPGVNGGTPAVNAGPAPTPGVNGGPVPGSTGTPDPNNPSSGSPTGSAGTPENGHTFGTHRE